MTVEDLPYVTGMPPDVVREVLGRLEARGVMAPEPGAASVVRGARPSRAAPSPEAIEAADAPEPDAPETAEAVEPSPEEPPAEETATHRRLYEIRLRTLTRDERLARVVLAVEPELSAFAFDPEPAVVHRLFDNPHAGLGQARLVAAHHGTTSGLEVFGKHGSLLADAQVQRLLLRNSMLSASLFQRVLAPRRLVEVHRVSISRDVPERTRTWARNLLRQKWATSPSEERVELIYTTEGRVLAQLVGLTLDSRATALLCKRQFVSVLFVRNLAAWPATPPPLIAHLLKQPLVQRQPALRSLLLRHPNTPSDLRRKA